MRILWLACYNPKINWRTGEVKITRCSEECGKQWRPKVGKTVVAKTKERGEERGRGKKTRREKIEEREKKEKEKSKKKENNGSEESSE